MQGPPSTHPEQQNSSPSWIVGAHANSAKQFEQVWYPLAGWSSWWTAFVGGGVVLVWVGRLCLWSREAGDCVRWFCSGSGLEPPHRESVRLRLRVLRLDKEYLDSGAEFLWPPNRHKVEHEN